jgi:hypothetical protein
MEDFSTQIAGSDEQMDQCLHELAFVFGVNDRAFSWLAGKIADGSAMAISRHGGSEDRISFALRKGQEPISYAVRCFRGTADELVRASNERHGEGTKDNNHYRAFIRQAEKMLAHPETLPRLSEVAPAHIARWRSLASYMIR